MDTPITAHLSERDGKRTSTRTVVPFYLSPEMAARADSIPSQQPFGAKKKGEREAAAE